MRRCTCCPRPPTAPDALVSAAQRMLAKQYHPDIDHGDLAQMVAINTAVERIRKAREAS
jgi:curved DNA-binding protein CbpA